MKRVMYQVGRRDQDFSNVKRRCAVVHQFRHRRPADQHHPDQQRDGKFYRWNVLTNR